MDEMPEKQCEKCGAKLVLKPVPGAKSFPRRSECPTQGWEKKTVRAIRTRFHKNRPEW
jgi:DNA-directed RNA polymerase subunit RPC12/RpoP